MLTQSSVRDLKVPCRYQVQASWWKFMLLELLNSTATNIATSLLVSVLLNEFHPHQSEHALELFLVFCL